MVVVAIVLCFTAFLIVGTDGMRFRSPCGYSYQFRCDDGICINKHQWCDNSRHCSDRSDEMYCNVRQEACDDDIHFKCDSGTKCIPIQGYCDGYSSCPDQSDERNCPCEEVLETEGNFQYEAYIDQYRTQQRCWKISVNEAQYLDLKVTAKFQNRDCRYGNVTVYTSTKNANLEYFPYQKHTFNDVELLCPIGVGFESTFYEDILIRYRSNYYISSANSYKDFLNITFQKIDITCRQSDAFKCSKNSCISPEKQCDGNKDCADGQDEENCDYGALSATYLNSKRINVTKWMRNQRNADWGWKENTHRAIVSLYLAGDANFNGSSKDDELIAKQLELEVFTYLLRHKFEEVSSTELASYISALLVICHDPHNFYGYDLIADLKNDLVTDSDYVPPFLYLTLCNAKEPLSEDDIDRLLKILELSSSNQGFILELQALTSMTLSCIKNNGYLKRNLDLNMTKALHNLKKQQMENGSFGNEYTTALVLQALIANNEENAKDWNPKSAIQFLSKRQEAGGSFGDFLTTYLISPILNAKSLVDVGKVNCTGGFKRTKHGNMASAIKNRFGKKIIVKYSLYIGDEKDQIHPLLLRAPENITVLELMALAADIDPKYEFKIHEIQKKKYIYEISNIPNDPVNSKFWFIYQGSSNNTMPIPEQSPDKVQAHEKDHIIMWYKTLDSL